MTKVETSRLEAIETAVAELTADEFAKFRDWFAEFDARLFDERIERDMRVGKLDWLAEEAEKEHAAGLTRQLK